MLPATLISFTTGMIFRPAMPPLALAHSTSALIWAVSSPMAVDTAAEPPRLTTEIIPIFTVVSVTPCESPVSGKSTPAAGAAVAAGADAAGAAVVGAAVTGAVTLTQRLALPTCLHCSDPSVVPTLAHVPPDLAAAPAVPVNNVAPSKANDAPAMTAFFDACKMNPPVRQATMCRPSPPRRLTKGKQRCLISPAAPCQNGPKLVSLSELRRNVWIATSQSRLSVAKQTVM